MLMNGLRGLVLVVAAVFSIASAKSSKHETTTTKAPKGVSDDDLYAATVRVLTRRGFAIAEKDKDAGVVITEMQVVNTGLGEDATLHAWRVTVQEGELEMAVDCEARTKYGRSGCGSDSRVEDFTANEGAMRSEIFDEAERRARKRKADKDKPPEAEE